MKKSRTLFQDLGILEYKVIEGDEAMNIAYRWLSIDYPNRKSFKVILGGKTYLWNEIHRDTQN
jgi:hypothetical protein